MTVNSSFFSSRNFSLINFKSSCYIFPSPDASDEVPAVSNPVGNPDPAEVVTPPSQAEVTPPGPADHEIFHPPLIPQPEVANPPPIVPPVVPHKVPPIVPQAVPPLSNEVRLPPAPQVVRPPRGHVPSSKRIHDSSAYHSG